jgi:hypothetical protein
MAAARFASAAEAVAHYRAEGWREVPDGSGALYDPATFDPADPSALLLAEVDAGGRVALGRGWQEGWGRRVRSAHRAIAAELAPPPAAE